MIQCKLYFDRIVSRQFYTPSISITNTTAFNHKLGNVVFGLKAFLSSIVVSIPSYQCVRVQYYNKGNSMLNIKFLKRVGIGSQLFWEFQKALNDSMEILYCWFVTVGVIPSAMGLKLDTQQNIDGCTSLKKKKKKKMV